MRAALRITLTVLCLSAIAAAAWLVFMPHEPCDVSKGIIRNHIPQQGQP